MSGIFSLRLLIALIGLSVVASGAAQRADAQDAQDAPSRGVFSFTFENDGFFGTDRYYTAGVRLAWQSTEEAPHPLAVLGRAFSPYVLPDAPVQWGADISESIYTPRKNSLKDPPRNDRPYAGMLLGTLSLSSMTERSLGMVDFALGVIGPGSGAGSLQEGIHSLIGAGDIKGWSHQISNRPAGMLTLERRWDLHVPLADTGLEVGIVPAAAVNAGNVQTSAAIGILGRFGQGLSMDFGPPRIRPALSGLGVFRPPDGFAWYLFAGVEGRAVAYEATLDGNHNGYWKIDREPLVGEVPMGFEVAYARARLAVEGVLQSKTFDSQSTAPFAFGSITLSIAF